VLLWAKRSRLREPDRDAETSAGNAPNRGALLSAGCRITPANRTSVPGSRPIGHESPPLPLSGSPRRFPRRGSGCQDVQRSAPAIVLPHFAVPIVELGAATRRPRRKRFSERLRLPLGLRLRHSGPCSPLALSLSWRPEESTGSSACRPEGERRSETPGDRSTATHCAHHTNGGRGRRGHSSDPESLPHLREGEARQLRAIVPRLVRCTRDPRRCRG
jgi:hypothetical protein